ncbi:MAG: glycerol-3-phosphate acyltransferase [Candidatus Celaenobacter polaris]|nr:glycerol-3-phosphate acyltransferase [Candidatus Celaenobacter polaris]
MEIYKTIILAIAAYFIGSISFSYIFAKKMTGKDIRNLKVKNAGAFNVFLTVGPMVGIIVGLLDACKTLLIILVAQAWGLDVVHTIVAASFGIVGHCFPIYYGFRGGKGAGTVVGILIYFIPIEFLICLIPASIIAFLIHRPGITPVFFILFSPLAAYISNKEMVLVNSIIYLVLLTTVLNAIIFFTKRDRKVLIDK